MTVRPLDEGDVGRGVELCRAAGWNQCADDWRVLLSVRSGCCFAAEREGIVVGTAAALRYGTQVGWVGMLLVDAAHRRQGVGTGLLTAALGALEGCRSVGLDATPEGRPLYEKNGFRPVCGVIRLRLGRGIRYVDVSGGRIRPMRREDLGAVVAADESACGLHRPEMAAAYFRSAPDCAHVAIEADGRIGGFVLGRPGHEWAQMGPLTAGDGDTARMLAGACLQRLGGRGILTDVPEGRSDWRQRLCEAGFREQRTFCRMVRGDALPAWDRVFSIAGPEWG